MSSGVASSSSIKRWLPIVVVLAGVAAAGQFIKSSSVVPLHCDRDVASDRVDVMMLSTHWCSYCERARRLFSRHRINYCEYDIERTARGESLYRETGLKLIPIIYIGSDVLVGFNRDEVAQALIANDLLSLDDY